jgi:hypothetical protein
MNQFETFEDISSHSPLAKRNMDDSVFTNLFGLPEYTLQLYKTLHPEDTTITEDEITIVTLENVLLNQPYNDLGFMAGNKLLIMVEAQSTWSTNIIVRGLLYMVQTIQNYIQDTQQNVYASKKLTIPEPEFYVIYTGSRKKQPNQIKLSEEFYGGRKSAIEVTVNVLYDGAQGDIINQYVTFTKVHHEQVKKYGRTRKAVWETIQICKNRNVLKAYLESREKEVVDIMMTLFNRERALEAYLDEKTQEAEQKGREKGITEGRQEGRAEGRAEGRQEGRAEFARQVAITMYDNHNPIDVIAATLQESVATIQNWLGLTQA